MSRRWSPAESPAFAPPTVAAQASCSEPRARARVCACARARAIGTKVGARYRCFSCIVFVFSWVFGVASFSYARVYLGVFAHITVGFLFVFFPPHHGGVLVILSRLSIPPTRNHPPRHLAKL